VISAGGHRADLSPPRRQGCGPMKYQIVMAEGDAKAEGRTICDAVTQGVSATRLTDRRNSTALTDWPPQEWPLTEDWPDQSIGCRTASHESERSVKSTLPCWQPQVDLALQLSASTNEIIQTLYRKICQFSCEYIDFSWTGSRKTHRH